MFVNAIKKVLRKFIDRNELFLKKLKSQGALIGKNVQIVDGNRFYYEPWFANLIEIADEVIISAGVRFVNHDSSYANVEGNLPTKFGKIVIKKNAYIGVNSIILPGVTIGQSSIIGAGSVVNKDIPDFVVAAGNPVQVLFSIEDGIKKYKNRLMKKNDSFFFIDLGGGYSNIKNKYGKTANDFIIRKYNDYNMNKDNAN